MFRLGAGRGDHSNDVLQRLFHLADIVVGLQATVGVPAQLAGGEYQHAARLDAVGVSRSARPPRRLQRFEHHCIPGAAAAACGAPIAAARSRARRTSAGNSIAALVSSDVMTMTCSVRNRISPPALPTMSTVSERRPSRTIASDSCSESPWRL